MSEGSIFKSWSFLRSTELRFPYHAPNRFVSKFNPIKIILCTRIVPVPRIKKCTFIIMFSIHKDLKKKVKIE